MIELPTVAAQSRLLFAIHTQADFDQAQWATLMFLFRGEQVLLIRKRRGHGAGLINAPGGKLEAGETPRQCAVRETREEVGIDLDSQSVQELGELRFLDLDGSRIRGGVFRADGIEDEGVATAEAIPCWTATSDIPYARMWSGDRFWLPWVLAGRRFRASLLCDGDQVLEARISALDAMGSRII